MGQQGSRGYLDESLTPTVDAAGRAPDSRPLGGSAMFDVFCTECSRRQLVFPGQVLGIKNDESGIHVVFRCSRDHVGIWDTGRSARAAAA